MSAQELSDALAESDISVSHNTLRQLMANHPGFQPSADESGEPMLSAKNFTVNAVPLRIRSEGELCNTLNGCSISFGSIHAIVNRSPLLKEHLEN